MDIAAGANGMNVPGGIGGSDGVGGPGAVSGGKTPVEAGTSDVERFQAAYNQEQPAAEVQPASVEPSAGIPQNPPPVEGAGMGDRILQGLGKVSDQVKTDREVAIDTLKKDDVSQADLLRANYSLLESTTIVSAVGKTAEKINQGIKTLQQG